MALTFPGFLYQPHFFFFFLLFEFKLTLQSSRNPSRGTNSRCTSLFFMVFGPPTVLMWSRFTPGSTYGFIWDIVELIWTSHIQDKWTSHSTVALAPGCTTLGSEFISAFRLALSGLSPLLLLTTCFYMLQTSTWAQYYSGPLLDRLLLDKWRVFFITRHDYRFLKNMIQGLKLNCILF